MRWRHTDSVSWAATLLLRYSVYLLYWYKSTNTDAELRELGCNSSTQVLSLLALLVQKYLLKYKYWRTPAASPILRLFFWSSVYLIYWYKSTILTDTCCFSFTQPWLSYHWRMLTYADVCWRMLTYAGVCWRMLTETCCFSFTQPWLSYHWRMLTYAGVCWRMLTYADVCWRMLTYTDGDLLLLFYSALALILHRWLWAAYAHWLMVCVSVPVSVSVSVSVCVNLV
jgi:hypothetical protein